MTIELIDAAVQQKAFAPLGEGERRWLRFLASQKAGHIREQEEAAIEAEDCWAQTDEACAVDPIG
jgi:hypothetical protein